jgi:Rho GTPase-activating protein 1
MDPLIKKEGLFRMSPRAMTVDILAEAYDRAQKFIVWREADVVLSHGHMKEGSGTVYVDELDQTEGYDVHAATGLIKHWYKELRDPIFPQSCYAALEKFYGVSHNDTDVALRVPQLLEFLSVNGEWSPINQTSRKILIMHLLPLLSRVTEFQDWNQMNAYNLAVCFAQCLMRGPDPIEDMRVASSIRRILMSLIMHWKADLAPKFGMDVWKFEDSLRMPEAVGDREDPPEERHGPRSSLEAQISGITLVDNESDGEIDERPPLPPRPPPSLDTAMPASNPVRRKPAPPVHNLPRYSMIIRETPAATLEHIDSYNSIPMGDSVVPSDSSDRLDEVTEPVDLPEYEPSSSISKPSPTTSHQEIFHEIRDMTEFPIREDPSGSERPIISPHTLPNAPALAPSEYDNTSSPRSSPTSPVLRRPLPKVKTDT